MDHSSGRLEILHEDQWIVVVDKPSGMLSVGFPGFHGKTALDLLTDRYVNKGKRRITAVHRLDRDTSGVMMFACSPEAAERIMGEWQAMVSERIYRCVCARRRGAAPLPDQAVIDLPIAYNTQNVGFVPKGSERQFGKESERAVTRMRVIERGEDVDLVECDLETGRKNQIRIHLSHLGHPIIGDEVYGKDVAGTDGGIGRLALHARVLAFRHPFTDSQMRFESPEPASFLAAVKARRSGPAGHQVSLKDGKAGKPVRAIRAGKPKAGKAGPGGTARRRRDSAPEAGLEPKPRRSKRFANGSKFIPGK